MTEWLGVEMWPGRRPKPKRHKVKDFPVLANQIRCATGFKHAPGGVLRLAAPSNAGSVRLAEARTKPAEQQEAAPVEIVRAGNAGRLLRVLYGLADEGMPLPRSGDLAALLRPQMDSASGSTMVLQALRALARFGDVECWVGKRLRGSNDLPRAVRLRDGRVLRNWLAPPDVFA